MAREKFQTLTEQMFYVLLSLQAECCGMDIMEQVTGMTEGRISIGPGTLYSLLESFLKAGLICETRSEGRRRCYLLTEQGRQALETERRRLLLQLRDYKKYRVNERGLSDEDNKTQI